MITFNAETHRYFDGAREIPCVSRILQATGHGFRGKTGDGWYATKGDFVHSACALYDAGTLAWDTLDDTVRPYVDAWAGFVQYTKWQSAAVEAILHCEEFDFVGTADREGVLPKVSDREMILDIKSGAKSKDHRLQLGAYTVARYGPYSGRHSAVLYLKATGKYSLSLFSPEETEQNCIDWLAVLAEYRKQEEDLWA